jgi:hypothetical protein
MQRAAKGYWKMRPERLRRKAEKVQRAAGKDARFFVVNYLSF